VAEMRAGRTRSDDSTDRPPRFSGAEEATGALVSTQGLSSSSSSQESREAATPGGPESAARKVREEDSEYYRGSRRRRRRHRVYRKP
jgi:hypothetical protein